MSRPRQLRRIRGRAAVVAWGLAATTACGGGNGTASGDVSIDTSPASSTSQPAAATTGAPAAPDSTLDPAAPDPSTPDANASDPSPPPEGSLVIAEPDPIDAGLPEMHVIAYRNGFLRFDYPDRVQRIRSSSDGQTWTEIESQPLPSGAGRPFSDGERIVVLHYADAQPGKPPTPWVSDDGGRTWTDLPMPEFPTSAEPYVTTDVWMDMAAIHGERIAVFGQLHERIDWASYARDTDAGDHGQVVNEGGTDNEWIVDFEDGYQLVVDLRRAGLPTPQPPTAVTVVTHDGTSWSQPMSIEITGPDLSLRRPTAGPAGFLYPAGSQAVISVDGITWTSAPFPDAASIEANGIGVADLVGGPLGYVVVTVDGHVHHSRDGRRWTLVHTYDPPDAERVMAGPWLTSAAGAAGFVLPIGEYSDSGPRVSRLLWSPDGSTWSEHQVPNGATDVEAVVASGGALVIPILAPDPVMTMPTLPADDGALVEAVTSAFYDEPILDPDGRVVWEPVIGEPDARCIAEKAVAAFGADRLREMRFGTVPFSLLSYGYMLEIDLEQSRTIAALMRSCSADFERLMILTVTGGTQHISDESAACVQAEVDDDVAAEMMAIELARTTEGVPSSGPDLSHLDPLVAAFDACLTEQELNAVDWN